jgi:hypothetical protein
MSFRFPHASASNSYQSPFFTFQRVCIEAAMSADPAKFAALLTPDLARNC